MRRVYAEKFFSRRLTSQYKSLNHFKGCLITKNQAKGKELVPSPKGPQVPKVLDQPKSKPKKAGPTPL